MEKITTLQELLCKITQEYPTALKQPFTKHPLARLIREQSVKIISPLLDDENLMVKASAGKGSWARVPWIAIFNKHETDSAQEGVSVVYLFSEDMQKIYLTMMLGVLNPIKSAGRKKALLKLKSKILDTRESFQLSDLMADDRVQIGKSRLGRAYEKAVIFYKEYASQNLPSNDTLVADLKKIINYYNHYITEANLATYWTNFAKVRKISQAKRLLKEHFVLEQNPSLLKEAKKQALKKYGEIRCSVCGFSFFEHYGKVALDFIEAHLCKPINRPIEKVQLKDLALVCSNCHRMIHLRYPPLSWEEIKSIYHEPLFK